MTSPLTGMAGWRAEHYPIEASEVSAEDAAAHSLRKWEGLRPEALAKHGVELIHCVYAATAVGSDQEPEVVIIDSNTCALCESFYRAPQYDEDDVGDGNDDAPDDYCATCPLAIARGGVDCSAPRGDELLAPWMQWSGKADPEPMIHWLKVAVAQQEQS